MSICTIITKDLKKPTRAFAEQCGDCIVVYYFEGSAKTEFFFNMAALKKKQRATKTEYLDVEQKVMFILDNNVSYRGFHDEGRLQKEEHIRFEFHSQAFAHYFGHVGNETYQKCSKCVFEEESEE